MDLRIYSAAEGIIITKDTNNEVAWGIVTAMFDPRFETPKSFILGNFIPTCIKRQKPNGISSRDSFEYQSSIEKHSVVIEECNPKISFSFTEKLKSSDKNNIVVNMHFKIHNNKISIIRKHLTRHLTWTEKLIRKFKSNEYKWSPDSAALDLKRILSSPPGRNPDKPWIEGDTYRNFIVKRNDRYITDIF